MEFATLMQNSASGLKDRIIHSNVDHKAKARRAVDTWGSPGLPRFQAIAEDWLEERKERTAAVQKGRDGHMEWI